MNDDDNLHASVKNVNELPEKVIVSAEIAS